MSSDGDISVADALAQLKKRARDESGSTAPAARPAIRWPEPPLPKIRKEESSANQLPPRIQQQKLLQPLAQPGTAVRPAIGQPGNLRSQIPPSLGGVRPAGLLGGLGGLGGLIGLQKDPAAAEPFVPFGPAVPPGGATGPALMGAGLGATGPALMAAVLGPGAVPGPGQTKVSFEILQSHAEQFLLGKHGAIKALKLYTKANVFVEKNTPDEEQARITLVGSPAEIDQCRSTINSLIGGMITTAMVFQMAGLPPPSDVGFPGLPGAAPRSVDQLALSLGATAPMPTLASLPGAMPTALPKPSLPLPTNAGLTSLGGGGLTALSMPTHAMQQQPVQPQPGYAQPTAIAQDTQIQEKLNDYYANWWSQYATGQQQGGDTANPSAGAVPQDAGPAQPFDKEALARLAEMAAKAAEAPSEPVAMPAAVAPIMQPAPLAATAPIPALVGDLTQRATDEVRQVLDSLGSRISASPDAVGSQAPAAAPFTGGLPPELAMAMAQSSPAAPAQSGSLSGLLNGGFQIRAQAAGAAPRAQKDNDSVLKMLQTMQGNVIQAKTGIDTQATAKPRGPAEALVGFEAAGGLVSDVTRSDPQLEALLHRMQSARPEMLETVFREVLQMLQSFNAEQVVEVLVKMETVNGFSRGELGGEVGKLLAPRLREFTGSQFTSLMSTYMAWLGADPGDAAAQKSRDFFVAASTEMSSRLMEFAPHEINCCLASLISSSFSDLRFFAQVGRAALARHTSFGPIQLTALLSLLSEVRLVHLDLFNAAAQFTVGRLKELRKIDLMRLARAFAKCNIRCDPVCQAVANEVLQRMKKGDKTDPNTTFKVEDLCEFSWICCCLQSYHEELFRIMFKHLDESPQVSTDALCLVYEIHLVLDSEHKEAYSTYRIDPDGVKGLLEHYKENRRDARRCSAKTRNDVTAVLKSLVEGTVSANHRTSTGLLVDVAALRKKTSTDGFIHVEIESSMSVIRALDQEESSVSALLVEGPVSLRRRILEKHGLIIVTLRESDWKNLDDSREKRRHLRAQLSALSDVLE